VERRFYYAGDTRALWHGAAGSRWTKRDDGHVWGGGVVGRHAGVDGRTGEGYADLCPKDGSLVQWW
jgi:hypothetical protein